MDNGINARGVNFIYTKEFIQKKLGMEFWESALSKLTPESYRIWSGSQLSLSSYPFVHFKEMVHVFSKETCGDETNCLAELYSYIADRSLNSLYKVFFRFSQPSFVLKNYPKLWSRFFTSGQVEVPFADAGIAEVKFTLPEIFLDWLPGACYGYSKKAVEMAGGKNVKVTKKQQKLLESGNYEIIYTVEWEA